MSILLKYHPFILRCVSSNSFQSITKVYIHVKARQSPYPGTTHVHRATVPDKKISWNVDWPEYKPFEYTAPKIFKNPHWADDPDPKTIRNYNRFDNNINRKSFSGIYKIEKETNRPINPIGRTGISGRGLLGRWGPNYAGDPIVTRWARKSRGMHNKVLEVLLITRKDNGTLAFPGGMVDSGETIADTVKRELWEEAFNSNPKMIPYINKLFERAISIFEGYIDDPRNTDNAWMETVALNAHDETGELTKDIKLEAGDDAKDVQWFRVDCERNLHASHESILHLVIQYHKAYEYWHDKQKPNESNGQK